MVKKHDLIHQSSGKAGISKSFAQGRVPGPSPHNGAREGIPNNLAILLHLVEMDLQTLSAGRPVRGHGDLDPLVHGNGFLALDGDGVPRPEMHQSKEKASVLDENLPALATCIGPGSGAVEHYSPVEIPVGLKHN